MKGLFYSLQRAMAEHATARPKQFRETLAVTVDGLTGVGFGSAVIAGLPEGNLLFLGAVLYLTLQGPTSADLGDSFAGDFAVGTTPASDGTLTAGDVDIIPSTAIAASAGVELTPRTRATHTAAVTGTVYDNTDGSLELNLNLLVDDADIGADGIIITATTELDLSYLVMGDD